MAHFLNGEWLSMLAVRTGRSDILECKFYQTPFLAHPQSEVEKVRSLHLYQLLAYLRAAERKWGKSPRGQILYALAGRAVSERWVLDGCDCSVSTIDLSREWGEIRGELLGVLGG